jgi:hypothetical protein
VPPGLLGAEIGIGYHGGGGDTSMAPVQEGAWATVSLPNLRSSQRTNPNWNHTAVGPR